MSISLTTEQQNRLDFLLQGNRYPEAYRYAKQVVIANGGDSRISNWLDKAADINEGNPSNFYSTLVRSATIEAANDQGMSLNNSQFQFASNYLAREVIGRFVSNGAIKDIESIIAQDVKSAVKGLGLTPEGWAGTMAGDWYILGGYGGLGLDDTKDGGQFHSYLAKDWKERGVESHFQKIFLWADIAENNMVGGVNAVLNKINIWSKLSDYNKNNINQINNIEDFKYYLKKDLESKLQMSLTDQAFERIIKDGQYFDLDKYSDIAKEVVSKSKISNNINKINISTDDDLVTYNIQSGDSLSEIAVRSGVSLDNILALNPQITNPNKIKAGSAIILKDNSSIKLTINDEAYLASTKNYNNLLQDSKLLKDYKLEVNQDLFKNATTYKNQAGQEYTIIKDSSVTLSDNSTALLSSVIEMAQTAKEVTVKFADNCNCGVIIYKIANDNIRQSKELLSKTFFQNRVAQ